MTSRSPGDTFADTDSRRASSTMERSRQRRGGRRRAPGSCVTLSVVVVCSLAEVKRGHSETGLFVSRSYKGIKITLSFAECF